VILQSSSILICSTLKEQHPTVSASSSCFSFPTLNASLSIKYAATPNWFFSTLLERSFSL